MSEERFIKQADDDQGWVVCLDGCECMYCLQEIKRGEWALLYDAFGYGTLSLACEECLDRLFGDVQAGDLEDDVVS